MSKKEDETRTTKEPVSGVFVTKGMFVDIPEFSNYINPEGKLESPSLALHTELILCPDWLTISYENLLRADRADKALMIAKEDKNDEKIAKSLQDEFTSGMQSIIASLIAIDAHYACVKDRIHIPADLTETWHEKRTARYKQISEVLNRAFKLTGKESKMVRAILKESFSFRDKAVHPPPGTTAPFLHPELNKITDWRYATFRFYNAKAIARTSLSIVDATIKKPRSEKYKELIPYCDNIEERIQPLLKRWKRKYGNLYQDSQSK